jgi:hypothetical protein
MTLHLFAGQGVKVNDEYGVIHYVPQFLPVKDPKTERITWQRKQTVLVGFADGTEVEVSMQILQPASMPLEEREELEQRIDTYTELRGSRHLIILPETVENKALRSSFTAGPVQLINIPPSGLTEVQAPGLKCNHGVYIPAPWITPAGRADTCTLCHPLEVVTKQANPGYRA